jgi:hypothetical protein
MLRRVVRQFSTSAARLQEATQTTKSVKPNLSKDAQKATPLFKDKGATSFDTGAKADVKKASEWSDDRSDVESIKHWQGP